LRRAFAAFALAWCGVAIAPVPAGAASQAYVDRRVTALPAATLLGADPQTLISRPRQEIAKTLAIYRRSLFVFWAISQIFVFYLLWQSGTAARIRDLLRRRIHSPLWLRFAYGFVLAAIAGLAAFPASAAQYRVSVVFDQSSEPFWRWLREGALHVFIDALVVGLIVAAVMTLVARMRSWWVLAVAGIFLVSLVGGLITPFVIAPLFNHYWPMNAGDAAPFTALEREAGVATPIWRFNSSRQSQIPNVSTIGIGPSSRIVLGDTMFAAGTPGEVRYAVAREIAHARRDDALRTAYVWTFFFVLSIAIGVLVADRIGFRRDDDPLARLALVGALAGLAAMLVLPLYNVYSRHIEEKADAYALSLTHDPASAVRSYVRSADRRFVLLCPPRLVTMYFWPTPPLGTRIAAATGRPDPCR
jgi:STE24 endopeptidase